jgi:hypothetical protein
MAAFGQFKSFKPILAQRQLSSGLQTLLAPVSGSLGGNVSFRRQQPFDQAEIRKIEVQLTTRSGHKNLVYG